MASSYEIFSKLKIPKPVSREELERMRSASAEQVKEKQEEAEKKYSGNITYLQSLKRHIELSSNFDRNWLREVPPQASATDRSNAVDKLRFQPDSHEAQKELYIACCETLRYYEEQISGAEGAVQKELAEEAARLDAVDAGNSKQFWKDFWGTFYPALYREVDADIELLSSESLPETDQYALLLWIVQKELPKAGADRDALKKNCRYLFLESKDRTELLIPFTAETRKGFTAFVDYDNSREGSLLNRLIEELLTRLLRYQKPVENRVIFLDGASRNAGNWPIVREMNDEHGFVWFPEKADWSAALKKLEKLNPLNEAKNNDPRWLIVNGYPNKFSQTGVKEAIDLIMENSAARAVNVLLCSGGDAYHGRVDVPIQHRVSLQGSNMTADGQAARLFDLTGNTSSLMSKLKEAYSRIYQPLSKNFLDNIVIPEGELRRLPPAERFRIEMPFAIDKKTGKLFSMKMSNHAPFAYIAARTQSGKTSVIHMMIFSLMMTRHPDDLELWLIDLKGTEYERYREDAPPHIRYILSGGLSEGAGGQTNQSASIRLAEEVVEKIREEVARREMLCKQYNAKGVSALQEQSIYLPQILIVLDEYSVIADIPGIQDSLNNLLKQAATFGVYGIFCNQEFKVSGLGQGGNNIPIRMGMGDMSPKKVSQLYQDDKRVAAVVTDGGMILPKYHSAYECPGGAYYLEHLFFQSETDLDELKRRLKKRFETYERLPRAQRKTDSAKGAWLVSDRADQYYEKEPVFRGVGESYPFKEYEELLKSLSKDGALFFGLPLSFKRTRALRFGTGSKQHALLIADARSLNAPTLVQETVRALFITAEYNGMQAEIWAMEADKPIRDAFPSAIGGKALSERLAQLKEEIEDRQPRLIIVSDVYRLFKEPASATPPAPSTYGINGFPVRSRSASSGAAADPLAQSAPQKASVPPIQELCELLRHAADRNCHFFIQANNLHELSSASALCPDYNLQKRLSTDGFEHIICAAQDEKSEAALEYIMGKKLRGLESNVLLYTETTTGKAYVMNPFDFGLRARVDLTPSEDE